MAECCYVPLVNQDDLGSFGKENLDVLEADDTPQKTGLLDANGTPLYRVRERVAFGFRGRK